MSPSLGFVFSGSPRARDQIAGCRCDWTDAYLIRKPNARCPISEHCAARSDCHRPRRILAELARAVGRRLGPGWGQW